LENFNPVLFSQIQINIYSLLAKECQGILMGIAKKYITQHKKNQSYAIMRQNYFFMRWRYFSELKATSFSQRILPSMSQNSIEKSRVNLC